MKPARRLAVLGLFVILIQSEGIAADLEDEEIPQCGSHASLNNSWGDQPCKCVKGFQSKKWPNGFKNQTYNDCTDIDECSTKKPCDESAICTNLPGSYQCSCLKGYIQYEDVTRGGNATIKCKEIRCPNSSEHSCSDRQPFLCDFKKQLGGLCWASRSMSDLAGLKKLLG
ncbi:hypothetical protein JRQ81_002356, partial [Phrynocephalus forsythii]